MRMFGGAAQRLQFWCIVAAFLGLGFLNGVQAVLLADVANALHLDPGTLGAALACISGAGIIVLFVGGIIAERLPRRLILFAGVGGMGGVFVLMANVADFADLVVTFLLFGSAASVYDLAVNTLGGDYERCYDAKIMTLLHAGFSGGAAFGALGSALALTAGANFRTIYLAAGLVLLLLAAGALLWPLPHVESAAPPEIAPRFALTGLFAPLILLAVALVCLSFFADGALEGYQSVYLRNLLGAGALLGGLGIAAFHLVGMAGRLGGTAIIRRYGERTIITLAGLISATGLVIALATTVAPLAVAGLLLVGLGQSPIVPTAFSLANRAGRGAQGVAFVTACGYSVFIIGPLLIGALADTFSLRLALALLIATSLGIALLARRIPR